MNNLDLHIENFQAISEMDLDFEEGINIIAGQSNSSKTSVLRAIEVLLRNQSGSADYIKHGEKGTLVNMKYLGNDVTWSRTKKDIVYEVNGEKYLKVGNTDLFKLLERNGFVIDPQDELANLEDEWTLPFPFYKSSSELFKLFENIFSVSDSAKILKGMKEDEDTCKKKLLEVDGNLKKTERKISAIQELNIPETVEKLSSYKEDIKKILDDKQVVLVAYNTLKEVYKKLKVYKNLPVQVDVDTSLLQEYKEDITSLSKLQELGRAYEVLKDIPNLISFVDYDMQVKLTKELQEDLEKLHTLEKCYKLQLPKVADAQPNYPSYISSMLEIREDLVRLKKLYKEGKELSEKRKLLLSKVSEMKEEVSKIDVCPLCGQEISEGLKVC